jgi:hypothetical protein
MKEPTGNVGYGLWWRSFEKTDKVPWGKEVCLYPPVHEATLDDVVAFLKTKLALWRFIPANLSWRVC